jgi:hypothetical protein
METERGTCPSRRRRFGELRPLGALIFAVALVSSTAGCHAAPSQRPMKAGAVDTGAGSLTAARQYLQGTWALESYEIYPPGKPPILLKGTGTLVYDEFGNLKIDVRADQPSTDLLRDAGMDLKEGGLVSDGRTAVDMQKHTLTYVVPGQTGRGPLSLSRPRHWDVQGNLLTLTTQDDNGKPLSVAKWRKSS